MIPISFKKCTKCGEKKPTTDFYPRRDRPGGDGLRGMCKKCSNKRVYEHRFTKTGVISRTYSTQKTHSARRGHDFPDYSMKELKEWAFPQPLFHELFDEWAKSGYSRNQKPSVDRIDDNKGYSLDNIQLTTALENIRKQAFLKKIGVKDDELKPVIAIDPTTKRELHFISIREAHRTTGAPRGSISAICHNKKLIDGKGFEYTPKTSAGFLWKFKNKEHV